MPAAGVARPIVVADRTVLEPGSPVVWFTFPGARHDIGRFHTADGRFTGCYANILTPVEMEAEVDPPGDVSAMIGDADDVPTQDEIPGPTPKGDRVEVWRTTDLFLDVFLDLDGQLHLLDEAELREAEARGWVQAATASTARREAERLMAAAEAGDWPPPVVGRWPLARARTVAARGGQDRKSPGSA